MVLYSLEEVSVLLSPIQKIHVRPTFGSLCHLTQQFYDTPESLIMQTIPRTGGRDT